MAVSRAGEEPAPSPATRSERLNAADVESRATPQERAAYRAGRIDALREALEERYAAIAGLERLEQMTLPELQNVADTVGRIIKAKASGTEPHTLHLVAQPGGNQSDRGPITRRTASADSSGLPEQRDSSMRRPPQGGGARADPH